MTVDYRVGDVRQVMATIPDASISLVASSPPFIALRSYLPDDHPLKHAEIGSEADPATFLDTLLELTAEWGRVLAPWGSIAIELGDTYAGSGGAGGDYAEGGLRDGQSAFKGSGSKAQYDRYSYGAKNANADRGQASTANTRNGGGPGWPRAKSLALIPQLYATSLAYGRNLLTGQPSPAGQWLVRNVIVWTRPNPAPGALGDKVRPSTSYITVATRSARRWFDLDAVRTPHTTEDSRGKVAYPRQMNGRLGTDGENGASASANNPAGAPPLDCWFDHHDTWTLTTQPSRVSIKTTEQVSCGPDDGGERTTSPDCPVHGGRSAQAPTEPGDERAGASSPHTPCTGNRPEPEQPPAGDCGASTSTRSDQPTASAHSTSSSKTAPALSTSQPDTPSAQTAARTGRIPASPESSGAHPDTSESNSDEVCPPADEHETAPHSDHTSGPSSACTCSFHLIKTSVHSHYAMWPAKLAERLILMMCPAEVCAVCQEGRRRVTRTTHEANRNTNGPRSIAQRHETPGFDVRAHRHTTTLGWSDCGHGGQWQPGVVLDPFAGSGTTLAVADLHHRDAIGIDLDERNRDLYPRRRDECARALFDVRPQMTGQLDIFGEPA